MPVETNDVGEAHSLPPPIEPWPNTRPAAELVEQVQELDLPTGKGYVAHWEVEGIGMHYARWQYRAPFAAAWRTDREAVNMHFNLRGRTVIENNRTGTVVQLASAEHNLSYYRGFDGLIRHEELESETFTIHFSKSMFLALARQANEPLRRFCAAVLRGEERVLSSGGLPLPLALHTAIREVLGCRFAGPLKKLFLYSKAIEIVAWQAHAIEQQSQTPRRYVRTDYDRERLLFARDYLLAHRALPPSLPELARLAGLNEFKLKNGFKELLGHTVFGYSANSGWATPKPNG